MLSIRADQKNRLRTNDFAYSILHFKQERRNCSPTFFNLLPSVLFYTHAHKQINVASQHVLKLFPSKKKAAVFRAEPLTSLEPPRPEGSGGGSAGPVLT